MSHDHSEFTAHNRDTWDNPSPGPPVLLNYTPLCFYMKFRHTSHQIPTDPSTPSSKAKDYDTKPWQKMIATQVASALTSHASWLDATWVSAANPSCRLLDYACGTGSVTRALNEHITHATGLDISPGMLDQYTSLLSSSHPSLHLTTAIADFCSEEVDMQPFTSSFEVAGVALGFHHFANPAMCIANLFSALKTGGVLFIVDWLPKDVVAGEHIGSRHLHPSSSTASESTEWKQMQKTIKTNGFTEHDMRGLFEGAGFKEFGFVVLEEEFLLQMNGKEVRKTGFIAKGRKV
ncbi:S-adenosyl-L-methionine-dependent methyltransferase [Aureobasidium sp. EXF-10727]|nr:S-adenosyl-L-methionine-dependent methyltransferase [Aureobasidium sp. EXF-10727]